MAIFFLVTLLLGVIGVIVVSQWFVYMKANQPGWACIVPVYNLIVLLKIVKRPIWWLVFLLLPYVNIVFGIICQVDLAKRFRQTAGFTVGLILVPFVFYPLLAFGNSTYHGEED